MAFLLPQFITNPVWEWENAASQLLLLELKIPFLSNHCKKSQEPESKGANSMSQDEGRSTILSKKVNYV